MGNARAHSPAPFLPLPPPHPPVWAPPPFRPPLHACLRPSPSPTPLPARLTRPPRPCLPGQVLTWVLTHVPDRAVREAAARRTPQGVPGARHPLGLRELLQLHISDLALHNPGLGTFVYTTYGRRHELPNRVPPSWPEQFLIHAWLRERYAAARRFQLSIYAVRGAACALPDHTACTCLSCWFDPAPQGSQADMFWRRRGRDGIDITPVLVAAAGSVLSFAGHDTSALGSGEFGGLIHGRAFLQLYGEHGMEMVMVMVHPSAGAVRERAVWAGEAACVVTSLA